MNKETMQEMYQELTLCEDQAEIRSVMQTYKIRMTKPPHIQAGIGFRPLMHKGWVCLLCMHWKEGLEQFAIYALPGKRRELAGEFFAEIIPDISMRVMGTDYMPTKAVVCDGNGDTLAEMREIPLPTERCEEPWRN